VSGAEVEEDDRCEHESWEVQADGSGICNDCGEETGGAGSNPVPGDLAEVELAKATGETVLEAGVLTEGVSFGPADAFVHQNPDGTWPKRPAGAERVLWVEY
jgi:hypothetical protein